MSFFNPQKASTPAHQSAASIALAGLPGASSAGNMQANAHRDAQLMAHGAPRKQSDNDTVDDGPRHASNSWQKTALSTGLGVLILGAAAGGGGYAGWRATHKSKSENIPPAIPPANYDASGLTLVLAANYKLGTTFENTAEGFDLLKKYGLGDWQTPQPFADFTCSATEAKTECTLAQALQSNDQHLTVSSIFANADAQLRDVSLTATCDSATLMSNATFTAHLPPVAQNGTSPNFFNVLNSPDVDCMSADGAPSYNFHFTLTAGNQPVGANNSIVLFKKNTQGQITDAIIGVNPGGQTATEKFVAPVYHLDFNLGAL